MSLGEKAAVGAEHCGLEAQRPGFGDASTEEARRGSPGGEAVLVSLSCISDVPCSIITD